MVIMQRNVYTLFGSHCDKDGSSGVTDFNLHHIFKPQPAGSLELHEQQSSVQHASNANDMGKFTKTDPHCQEGEAHTEHTENGTSLEVEPAGSCNTDSFSIFSDESPEMQVVVNTLTPVLQRRRTTVRSISLPGTCSYKNTEQTQVLTPCFQNGQDGEGKCDVDREQKPPLDQSREEELQLGKFTETDRPHTHSTEDLFIKPKFSRTWHGSGQTGGTRTAPRMGTGMMMTDASPAPGSLQSGVHTMPAISRTLLDAMHKRYCSYQYSYDWDKTHSASVPTPGRCPCLQTSSCRTLKRLGSDGESDTGSSAGGSCQSSPQVAHSQAVSAVRCDQTSPATVSVLKKQEPLQQSPAAQRAEIEALEACQWLRAAGFPQYAQMFEDGHFPVDISDVQRDHDFLDIDSIQSLFRRLNILNQCAVMKIDAQPRRKAIEESDEEDLCALSDRWEYQKTVRRWSRKGPELTIDAGTPLQPSNSHDSLLADQDSGSHTDDSPVLDSKMPHKQARQQQDPPSKASFLNPDTQSSFPISPKLRRAASERLKSALKKMESFKKKSKKYPASRNIVEISGPVVADEAGMQAKLEHLNCVDLSPTGPAPDARASPDRQSTPKDSSGKFLKMNHDAALSFSPVLPPTSPITPPPASERSLDDVTHTQADLSLSEYYTAHSQLLASLQSYRSDSGLTSPVRKNNSDTNLKEIFLLPQDHKPGSFPRRLHNGYIDTSRLEPGQQDKSPGAGFLHTAQVKSTEQQSLGKWQASRGSVYDNLPPGFSAHPGEKRPHVDTGSQSGPGQSRQIVRSHSLSASDYSARQQQHETPEILRSHSTSTGSSSSARFERTPAHVVQDFAHRGGHDDNSWASLPADGEGDQQIKVSMDEFDSILQGLYREISDLSRAIGVETSPLDGGSGGGGESGSTTVVSDVIISSGVGVSSRVVAVDASSGLDNGKEQTTGAPVENHEPVAPSSERKGLRFQLTEEALDESASAGVEEERDSHSECSHSHSSSDQEEDLSADDVLEQMGKGGRERRDSGVGSSLGRATSERKQKKIRWHSFQKCHRPSVGSRELQIGGLSVCQLLPIRQLSLLKLTAIMERCSPSTRSQWSWSVPRFMKRTKIQQFSDKNVFGVPFTTMLQRTGQPLPQCVLYAMRYLRRTSQDALGIFRKSGVRSRIQKLRDMVEACPDSISFDELQPYDVADLLKQYFRELPECLLTSKLSDTFRSIFTHVPHAQRLEALQTAVILLPEENLEVLHCLLLFLGDIAQHADQHQMNASNLAVCFAPSLFNLTGSHSAGSPRRQRKSPGVPDQRELLEQKAVHECFTYMITNCKKLFMVPPSMYSRLHLSTLSNMEPVHLDEFYASPGHPGPDYRSFGEEHIQILLKEAHDKNRGWVPVPVPVNVAGIEVTQRKPQDGHPLRQWKCSVDIDAPPIEVLNRILHERHTWDDDLLSWSVLERLDKNADVFHYVLNSMAPHPPRHFTIIRYWRPDMVKGACAFVSRSVEHPSLQVVAGIEDVRAVELGSCYLMEPCGSGRSRFTYISRIDLRGRCPEWYNRVFGHLCANFVERLRDSFRQEADGPETKV